jgi:hypothetical protein
MPPTCRTTTLMLVATRRRHPPPVPETQRHDHRPDAGPRVQAGQRVRGLLIGERQHPVKVTPADGGWDVKLAGGSYAVRSHWQFGDILYRGTLNGEQICMQVERRGRCIACSTGACRPTCR